MSAPKIHDVPTALALMKAAPALLEAAKNALDYHVEFECDQARGECDHVHAGCLRAAIAEATPAPPPPRPPGPFVAKATRECICETCQSIRSQVAR